MDDGIGGASGSQKKCSFGGFESVVYQ